MDQKQGTAADNFFERPDSVDFITRLSPYVEEYVAGLPHARMGKMIDGSYAVVYVPRDLVDETLRSVGVNVISLYPAVLGLLDREALEATGITQVQRQPYLELRGQGVLLGFVDTGIDYQNDVFRYEDGSTRIKSIWDQSVPGSPPDTYQFGTEYGEARINDALRAERPLSAVPHRDTVGHGTFLASVACGRGMGEYEGATPDAELIVVKLRAANAFHRERQMVPPEQENAYSSSDVMLGVEYIIEKARELGRPVSICIALGTNMGSHDGFDVLEEYLTRSASHMGVSLCVAGGNEALARRHASGVLERSGESRELEIQSIEGAGALNLQIWNGASDRLSVSVTSPTGEVVGRVPAKAGTTLITSLILERSEVSVQYFFPNPRSGSQLTWIKITDPTPGVWTVTVYGDIVLDGTYNAWLPMTGFAAPGVEFLHPDPECTITVPATSAGIMAVGAYDARTGSLYANSSWGPSSLPSMLPDFCAPGVQVGGVYPTGTGAMTGTSVAAAIAAGASALMMQWGIVNGNDPQLNTYLINSYLARGCERDPGVVYPNYQWGYGRLNLYNAFVQLMGR